MSGRGRITVPGHDEFPRVCVVGFAEEIGRRSELRSADRGVSNGGRGGVRREAGTEN